tara:strand:- start:423 stop:1073 length:651 start_codon:yes stop_codon:yes gene_type:complete
MAYIGKRPTDSFRSLAVKDTFTGDGSTVAFDISQECGSANDLMVFVDNVRQEPGSGKSYTLGLDGSNLLKRITFDAAPDASAEIYVINPTLSPEVIQTAELSKDLTTSAFTGQTELAALAADNDVFLVYDTSAGVLKKIQKSNIAATLSYVTRNYTGDNSDTTFTVTSGVTVDNCLVMENGVVQKPTSDYTVSGTTLTFTTAPATGVAIQIRELPR